MEDDTDEPVGDGNDEAAGDGMSALAQIVSLDTTLRGVINCGHFLVDGTGDGRGGHVASDRSGLP